MPCGRIPDSGALTLYLGLQTPQGVALNTLSSNHGQHQGIWIVEDGQHLARGDGRCRWTKMVRVRRLNISSTDFARWATAAQTARDPFTHSCGRRSKSCRAACPIAST